jgi:hypothetical protein
MAAKNKFANTGLHLNDKEEALRKRLLGELDKALSDFVPSRKQTARILTELRPLYSKPGCKGRWTTFLLSKKIAVSTANDLVRRYKNGWVDAVRKPRKTNQPKSGGLRRSPHVDLTGKPFPDGKEIVEALFALTADQKQQFIESVSFIGAEEATQIMFEAVVREAGLRREGKKETIRTPLPTPHPAERKGSAFLDDEADVPIPAHGLLEQMEREAAEKKNAKRND